MSPITALKEDEIHHLYASNSHILILSSDFGWVLAPNTYPSLSVQGYLTTLQPPHTWVLVLPLLIWPLTSSHAGWSTVATTALRGLLPVLSVYSTVQPEWPFQTENLLMSLLFQYVLKLLNRVCKALYKSVPIYLSCLILYCCCWSVAKSCPSLCDAMDCSALSWDCTILLSLSQFFTLTTCFFPVPSSAMLLLLPEMVLPLIPDSSFQADTLSRLWFHVSVLFLQSRTSSSLPFFSIKNLSTLL